ncbi:MAG: YjjG family noncanonical pyrimidine nucleotidase [Bacteroidaceae bacterium]|nr:YjjG family noncanonical pyrimidine nucleotidase [Bacteroidaceae bacterium]
MKKYLDLFIDFDDTLYDTHGNAVIALSETFEEFHLDRYFTDPQVFYDAYWAANIDLWGRYSRGEITRDNLIVERFRRPLSEAVGIDITAAYCIEMSDRFLDHCASKPGVLPGAHHLMDYLRQRGYRMHMTSNGFHEVQYKKLDSCGLRSYFDTIILSEDAGANKPSYAFFDYALRQSGAEVATTLMIGDNLQTDIFGAMRAGLDTLLYNRWNVTADEMFLRDGLERADSSPTYVVESLAEILNIL